MSDIPATPPTFRNNIAERLFRAIIAVRVAGNQLLHQARTNQRGDVTTTVIIIAVLVAAAVAAGVVITSFISEQTDKIG